MKRVFAAVYLLVLTVQLPHVSTVYASLEQQGWYRWLGWPLAAAFELSILVFTYRLVVERSDRPATKAGLVFFLTASAVANAAYYQLAPQISRWIMPAFATLALPLSLGLFASEFGAEVRREEKQAQRDAAKAERAAAGHNELPPATPRFACSYCPQTFRSQHALNAHQRAHSKRKAADAR